jgi:addiction module HigA family antidote
MIPKNRIPTHPEKILLREFLEPVRMTQAGLAGRMHVPIQRINTLINEKRDMTPETAILLSMAFGTSAEFWDLQTNHDLAIAEHKMAHV